MWKGVAILQRVTSRVTNILNSAKTVKFVALLRRLFIGNIVDDQLDLQTNLCIFAVVQFFGESFFFQIFCTKS